MQVKFLHTTLFQHLSNVHITKIACLLREHRAVKGEVVFSEGQPVRGLYFAYSCGTKIMSEVTPPKVQRERELRVLVTVAHCHTHEPRTTNLSCSRTRRLTWKSQALGRERFLATCGAPPQTQPVAPVSSAAHTRRYANGLDCCCSSLFQTWRSRCPRVSRCVGCARCTPSPFLRTTGSCADLLCSCPRHHI